MRIKLLALLMAFAHLAIDRPAEAQKSPAQGVLPTTQCGHYFVAETYINGKGPFQMLLDSGASMTTISKEVDAVVNPGRRIESLRLGELRLTGSVRYQTKTFDHLDRALGIEIDGILGHDVFRPVLLTYDYPAGEIRYRIGELRKDMPGIAPMSRSRRPFVGAVVGDRKLNILLDTGLSGSLQFEEMDTFSFESDPIVVGATGRFDGFELSRAGRLTEDVVFGSFVLEKPVVHNASGTPLIGQGILKDFVVTMDQQSGLVQIVRPDGTNQETPITARPLIGTGLIVIPQENALAVARIEDDSNAALAGLQKGDLITHINQKRPGDRGCQRWLEEPALGQRLSLTILRDGRSIERQIEVTTLVP